MSRKEPLTREKLESRFWSKVVVVESCWEWVGFRHPEGYGKLRVGPNCVMAHRVAYELYVGRIPNGLQLDHLCRNRGCVNPAHLEAVTSRENSLRGNGPAGLHWRSSLCPYGHEYAPPKPTKDGLRTFRVCSVCHNARTKLYQRARRAAKRAASVAVSVCALAVCAVAGERYPRPALYANTAAGGWPLVRDNGTVDTLAVQKVARFSLVTLNVTPFADQRAEVPMMLHRYNPAIKLLAYDLVGDRWMPPFQTKGTMWQEEHAAIDALDGWLYDTNGVRWYAGYAINLGRKDVADTLASIWRKYVWSSGYWDGAFYDYASSDIAWTDYNSPRDIDLARAGFKSLGAQDSARKRCWDEMRRENQGRGCEAPLVVGNGISPRSAQLSWSGRLYEGWPHAWGGHEAALKALVDDGRPWNIVKTECYEPPYSASWNRAARYGVAVGCIAGALACIGPDRDQRWLPFPYLYAWADEYAVTPYIPGKSDARSDTTGRYTGWLGEEVGPPSRLASGAWVRDFPNGRVIVNPTDSTVTVDCGVAYRGVYGVRDPKYNHGGTARYWSVPSHDARFLVRLPRGRVMP